MLYTCRVAVRQAVLYFRCLVSEDPFGHVLDHVPGLFEQWENIKYLATKSKIKIKFQAYVLAMALVGSDYCSLFAFVHFDLVEAVVVVVAVLAAVVAVVV